MRKNDDGMGQERYKIRSTFCKSCGKEIVWIKTIAGKAMPCDAEPRYYCQHMGDKSKIVTPNGEVLSCEILENPEQATGIGYTPHWGTCSAPNRFRRGER